LAAWDEGVAFVREHRVHFFEGFLARDAARLHTFHGEPEAALVLFGDAIVSFHRAGNVPQLIITLASVPALFERLERFEAAATLLGAMSRHESSFHHVPELADLEGRLATKLEAKRTRELVAEGAAFGLDTAAVYGRQQIDAARRDPRPRVREERPGGLSGGPVVAPEGAGLLVSLMREAIDHDDHWDEWCEPAAEAVRLLLEHESADVRAAARRVTERYDEDRARSLAVHRTLGGRPLILE